MASFHHFRRIIAFSRIELLAIIAMAVVLGTLAVFSLANFKAKSSKISCNCRLKQIGLAFRVFANDRGDVFPVGVSTNKGGSLEYAGTSEVFRHFQAMSNELSTPKVLVCPADARKPAISAAALHKGSGNVALGDGSVQSENGAGLRDQLAHSGLANNRLLIP